MRTVVTTLIPILALACAGEAGRTPPPSTAEGSTAATAAEASAPSKPLSAEETGRPAIELPVLGTSVVEDWQPSVSAPVAPPSATCRGRLDAESVHSCPAALAPALRDALRRAPPVQRDRALAELQGCFAYERGALVNLRAALQS
ncbi:MAG TPA: hypothetical protein VLC09_11010, partial [Polyangiaceae bacterium]|nr:hypothetical protein [Polyangiaceae bacterium]